MTKAQPAIQAILLGKTIVMPTPTTLHTLRQSPPTLPTPSPPTIHHPILQPPTPTSQTVSMPEFFGAHPVYKVDHTCCFYIQNINRIPGKKFLPYACHELSHQFDQCQGDINGMIKTNLNWKKGCIQRRVKTSLSPGPNTTHLATASSGCYLHGPYQPGSIACQVRHPWFHRILHSISDQLGRWTSILIHHQATTIKFTTAYAVCQTNSTQAGPNTAARKQ